MNAAQPLAGRTILVTRARHQAGSLSTQLQALGAKVIELPAIEIVSPDSYEPLDTALRNLSSYQWLVVTSANTVGVLAERLTLLGLHLSVLKHLRVAAVGRSTAEVLERAGVRVDVVPERYVGESLAAALKDQVQGSRVLLVRAAIARDVVPEALTRCGALVDNVDAYNTVLPESSIARGREVLDRGSPLPDAVTFTSSSTVTNFFRLLKELGRTRPPAGLRALSIGPITSATLREHGWEPAAEAVEHTVPGLVEAAVRALRLVS